MDPEQEKKLVVSDVEKHLVQVHKAFEDALRDIVTNYFEKRPVNKHTVPDLARDKIKYLLEQKKQEKPPYELEDLSRNGISLICRGNYYKKYNIKIIYSPDGKLPVVGMSGRKKRILCQRNQPNLWSFRDMRSIFPLKDNNREMLVLVILWNARFVEGIAYQDLLLVRPIEGKNNQPVIYWSDSIKEPATNIEETPPSIDPDDLDDDLGISIDVS